MNAVAKFFLRAKHWQILSLLFGIFVVAFVAFTASIFATTQAQEVFRRTAILYAGFMVLLTFFLVSWFWFTGSFLNTVVLPSLRPRMGFFRFAVIYALIYMPVFLALFDSTATHPVALGFILPFHLFASYCLLYLLYFVSKNLVLAERGKPASFYDYSGPFFLLWFFPIGVWIIQPKVNRLYEERGNLGPASGDSIA